MRTLPRFATALLVRFGSQEEPLLGDLVEEYAAGRSRAWYWRQALAAVALGAMRNVGAHPARTVIAIAAGWTTAMLVFVLAGDRIAHGLARWLWAWDRATAYQTGEWWPFWITSSALSYGVFALSAVVVARVARRPAGPVLVAYAGSMVLVLAASAVAIDVLTRMWGRVPVPHPLFYVVSVALPFYWRAGLVLAPAIVLAAGGAAMPRPVRP
jgi:hypothetical protein